MHVHEKDLLNEAHKASWKTFWIWLGFAAAFGLAVGLLMLTVATEHYLLAIPAVLLLAHLAHSQLLAFHEAAHGVLCPKRWLNELIGMGLGTLHLVGLSLFRAVHHTHHAYLGTEKDEQLWPFVQPRTPRWLRRGAAAFELCFGMLFDLIQFWRAFLRRGSLVTNPAVRRRIWLETAFTATVWGSILTVTFGWGTGKWLCVLYVIPALLAGAMHSWRKYIEHLGLTGSTVTGLTRTIVPQRPLGRLLAFTMFNINYHGVHHYYPRMPQTALPGFTGVLTPQGPTEPPVYPSYWSAFWAMLPTLADPKIGPQWNAQPPSAATAERNGLERPQQQPGAVARAAAPAAATPVPPAGRFQ
jgi:fatty acid desaturase